MTLLTRFEIAPESVVKAATTASEITPRQTAYSAIVWPSSPTVTGISTGESAKLTIGSPLSADRRVGTACRNPPLAFLPASFGTDRPSIPQMAASALDSLQMHEDDWESEGWETDELERDEVLRLARQLAAQRERIRAEELAELEELKRELRE